MVVGLSMARPTLEVYGSITWCHRTRAKLKANLNLSVSVLTPEREPSFIFLLAWLPAHLFIAATNSAVTVLPASSYLLTTRTQRRISTSLKKRPSLLDWIPLVSIASSVPYTRTQSYILIEGTAAKRVSIRLECIRADI